MKIFIKVPHLIFSPFLSLSQITKLDYHLQVALCRDQTKRLVSLSMWQSLGEARRDMQLAQCARWRKYWRAIQRKDSRTPPEELERLQWERRYLRELLQRFLVVLETVPEPGPDSAPLHPDVVRYCERFLEFVMDLEALLPTRRFFNTLLDDCHLVVRCQLSNLVRRPEGHLFAQVSNNNVYSVLKYKALNLRVKLCT